MNCRDVIELLMDYVAGTVSVEERAIFEAHFAACPPCVTYLKSYRVTVELGQAALADPDDPPPMPAELVTVILAARRGA